MNGLQAPAQAWPSAHAPYLFAPGLETARDKRGHPEGKDTDAVFERSLESVLSPRTETGHESTDNTEPPFTTRSVAQVKTFSRATLEEELLRVQMQRDDLRDRLLREREVKTIEAKQWRKRALHAQELLISERRTRAVLEDRVTELEQLLGMAEAAPTQSQAAPKTFAFENGVFMSPRPNLGPYQDATPRRAMANGMSGQGAQAAATSLATRMTPPPHQSHQHQQPAPPARGGGALWAAEGSAGSTPRRAVPAHSAEVDPMGGQGGSGAVTPGRVANLIGSFSPPEHSGGARAPTPSLSTNPSRQAPQARAQSEPVGGNRGAVGAVAGVREAVLAPTSPKDVDGQGRMAHIPRGEGGGVGLRFGITQEGQVYVTEVMAGATAERFGKVRVGDQILAVDGVEVAGPVLGGLRGGGDGIAELSRLIRGPAGTVLSLKLRALPPNSSPPTPTRSPPPASATPRPSSPPDTARSSRVLFPASYQRLPSQTSAQPAPGDGTSTGGVLGYWRQLEAQAREAATTPRPGPHPRKSLSTSPPGVFKKTPQPERQPAKQDAGSIFRFLF